MNLKMASRFLKLEKSEESFKLPSFLSHSKTEKHNSSNHEKDFSNSCNLIKVLKTRIVHLLKSYPNGIQIERFNLSYKIEYDEYLYPSDYGFNDLVDLLKSFSPILSMNVEGYGEYSEIMLYAKSLFDENELIREKHIHVENENLDLQKNHKERDLKKSKIPKTKKVSSREKLPASAKLPSKVLSAFNAILSSHSGGINIDFLSSEYKYYTGEELEPSRLGFNSILDMLSNLSDIFTIRQLSNGGFILSTTTVKQVVTQNSEVKNSEENSVYCPSLSDENEEDVRMNRKLPLDVQDRLKSLFENHFPNGLEINEVVGAYRGIYGATLEDLNPLEYGYSTLEAFLKAHDHLLYVLLYDKNIMVFHAGYLKEVALIEFPLPACSTVSSNESYTTRHNYEVFMKNTDFLFFIGEVYTPFKFHVIHQGEKSSEALNALGDQMYEFYNSPISKRYKVETESMILRTPVAALYSNDMNWYRAIIISFNNINKVKLFLVDYGTTCSCPYTALRLLHRNFFKLPAQAVSASLYGIKPSRENQYWSKTSSNDFKNLVQNKYFQGRVHEVSENLVISLWNENDVNINELLVNKGFASYIDGYEKEINNDKVIEWMNKMDINENKTILNLETHVEPQEHTIENLIDFLSVPLIKVNENIDPINTETADHSDDAGMEQMHYENGNDSACSIMVNDQSFDEFYKKRKVELVKISSDQNIHIVFLCGAPYMLSSEISGFMWDSDELSHQLERKEIDVPYVVIKSSTHADIFTQLSHFGVKNILDENKTTVMLYPLETALKILNIFKYRNIATMNIIKGVIHGWRD